MAGPVHIRIGGYSPPDTSHSRAMVLFQEKMGERLGDGVKTDIFWNVMDFGYGAPDLLAMVECGLLGMCYFSDTAISPTGWPNSKSSTCLFCSRIPPTPTARSTARSEPISPSESKRRRATRTWAFWDNGFRHLSNSVRDVRTPEGLPGSAGPLTAQRDARQDL